MPTTTVWRSCFVTASELMANPDDNDGSSGADDGSGDADLAGTTHEDVASKIDEDWDDVDDDVEEVPDAMRTQQDATGGVTQDLSVSDSNLAEGPDADAGAWDQDDLEVRPDSTTIDRETGRQFIDGQPKGEADVDDDSEVFPQVTGPAPHAFEPSETDPPPLEADLNRRSIEDLGPAFPDVEEDFQSDSFPPPGAPQPPEPPADDAGEPATSARPSASSMPTHNLGTPKGRSKSDSGDGWDGFDEGGSGGWPGLNTGESDAVSDVVSQPAASPGGQKGQYARRDTNVYKLGQRPASSGADEVARLVGIVGADEGREFAVNEREVGIGRVPSNDVVLSDHSVSREHARLLNQGDSFALIDLRSANGTFVNGQRIDRAKVRSGDELGFGNARFRFLEIGDVFKPVDASGAPVLPGAQAGVWHRLRESPHFKSVLISASMLLVTITVTIVILLVRGGGSDAKPQRDTIFQYYLQGVEAFKQRDWTTAETQFSIIRGLDGEHKRARQYLEEIGREKRFETQLAAARTSRGNGDLAQAYAQASSIVDSLYSPEANEIMRDVDAELDARVARARTTLDAGNATEALELLVSVDRVRPGRPDVLALRDRAAQSLGSGETVVETPSPPRAESPRPSPRTEKPRGRSSPLDRATGLFSDGKTQEALKALDAAGDGRESKVLRAKIDKFNKVYAQALAEHRNKRTQPAIKQLKQAKAFVSKIVSGKSRIADEIHRKLADMHYVQGMEPMLARRYAEAYRNFKTAVTYMPGHGPSSRQLEALTGKAKEFYEEGYRLKDMEPDTARQRWKLVMQIVPSNNEYYRKAKQRLNALP